jgi:hypothetical protein
MSKDEAEITRGMQRHLNKNKGDAVESGRWKTNKEKWTPYNHNDDAGKGDSTRSRDIPDEEYDIRWDLAFGKITRKEYVKRMKELKGDNYER